MCAVSGAVWSCEGVCTVSGVIVTGDKAESKANC